MTQTEVAAAEQRPKNKSRKLRPGFSTLAMNYGVVFFLILLVIVFSILLPSTFPTETNSRSLLTDQAIPLILAIAAVLPLAAGEFDLSIGATLGFTAITAITLSNAGLPLGVVSRSGRVQRSPDRWHWGERLHRHASHVDGPCWP